MVFVESPCDMYGEKGIQTAALNYYVADLDGVHGTVLWLYDSSLLYRYAD